MTEDTIMILVQWLLMMMVVMSMMMMSSKTMFLYLFPLFLDQAMDTCVVHEKTPIHKVCLKT